LEFEFNPDSDALETDNPLYDLIWGGYLDPRSVLASEEQADEVDEALEIIRQFLTQAEANGKIEYY
jgi:hypothetical protein